MVTMKNEEDILCSASTVSPALNHNTVGAAIEAYDGFLKNLGVNIAFAPIDSDDGEDRRPKGPSPAILGLPCKVKLGITYATGKGLCSHASVGKVVTENVIIQGNVIAFYSVAKGKFLRIQDSGVSFGGAKPLSALPLDCGSERFMVVKGKSSTFAFYNPCHRRFLGAPDRKGAEPLVRGYPVGGRKRRWLCMPDFLLSTRVAI